MRKLSQILAVGVITLTPFAIGSSALAVEVCNISGTGPGSSNECLSTATFACTVDTKNVLTIFSENGQTVATGTAASTGNTESVTASTGTATNNNGTTFNATVTNEGVCTVVAIRPATEATGAGAGAGAASSPVASVTKAVPAPQGKGAASGLPNTSADSTLAYVAGLIGIFGAVAVTSRMAVMAYSRLKS